MKKKQLLAFTLVLAMGASLMACGVSTEDSSDSSSADAGTEATADGGEAAASTGDSIKLFNGKIEIADAVDAMAAAYEEATGVHVDVESVGGGVDLQATLKQYYQAGNMPDIFICEGWEDFSNWDGMLADMSDSDWASRTDVEFVCDVEGAQSNGLTIGFPYTTEAIGLAYNADILEAAGIDVSTLTSPAAYAEAFATLDSKKDELGITAVVGYCAEASSLYWSTGQHIFGQYIDAGLARDDTTYIDLLNDNGQYDEARLTDFAEFVGMLNQYSDPDLLVSGTYDQQVQGFASGKYAFCTQGSWIGASMTSEDAYKSDYDAAGNFTVGFAPYAFEDGIDTILTNPPSWWGVYNEGNVDAAKAFLEWVSQDGQEYLVSQGGCNSPFTDCTIVADDPFAQTVADYTAAGKTSNWHWLDQPGNLAQDYTGIIFQDYASGSIASAEDFAQKLIQVTPSCYAAQ